MVQLNEWCLRSPLCSLMRSWITCTIGSEYPCAIGTTEYFRGLTGHDASYSLVSFIWNRSRSQLFPLVSGSSNSLSLSLSLSQFKSLLSGSSQKVLSHFEKVSGSYSTERSLLLSFFFLFIWESLEVTLQSFGNYGSSVIITFCVFGCSFCELQSHMW